MNIEIPRIIRSIHLYEYGEEYGEVTIEVWVNPSRKLLREFQDTLNKIRELRHQLAEEKPPQAQIKAMAEQLDALGEKVIAFLATIWSQGAEDKRWSPEEVRDLFKHSFENDPALWQWLMDETLLMISMYRGGQKKVLRALSGI